MPLVPHVCDSSAVTYGMQWTLHQVTYVRYNLFLNVPLPVPHFSAVVNGTLTARCPSNGDPVAAEYSNLDLQLTAIATGNFDSTEDGLAQYDCEGDFNVPCARVEIWTEPRRLGGVRPCKMFGVPPAEPVSILLTGTGDGYDGLDKEFEVHHVSEWHYTSPAVMYCRQNPGQWCVLKLDCANGPPCTDSSASIRGTWRRPRLRQSV